LDFDPAYPEVFFLMVKWYWSAEELGQQLLEQNPTTRFTYMYFVCASALALLSPSSVVFGGTVKTPSS